MGIATPRCTKATPRSGRRRTVGEKEAFTPRSGVPSPSRASSAAPRRAPSCAISDATRSARTRKHCDGDQASVWHGVKMCGDAAAKRTIGNRRVASPLVDSGVSGHKDYAITSANKSKYAVLKPRLASITHAKESNLFATHDVDAGITRAYTPSEYTPAPTSDNTTRAGCCQATLPSTKSLGSIDDVDLTPTVDAALEKSHYLFSQLARLDLSHPGPEDPDQVSPRLEIDAVARHDQDKNKAPLRPPTVEVPVAWIAELVSILGRLREIEERSKHNQAMTKLTDFKWLPVNHLDSSVSEMSLATTASPHSIASTSQWSSDSHSSDYDIDLRMVPPGGSIELS